MLVDVVGAEQRDDGSESEEFTRADALVCVKILSEFLLKDVFSSSELPLC